MSDADEKRGAVWLTGRQIRRVHRVLVCRFVALVAANRLASPAIRGILTSDEKRATPT